MSAADLKYANVFPAGSPRISVDASGFVYLVGSKNSTAFPTTPGVFQPVAGGGICGEKDPTHHAPPPKPCNDIVLIKWKPETATPAYATYVGGSGEETVGSLFVDDNGHAYVSGSTTSSNFPFTQTCTVQGEGVVSFGVVSFVAKVNPDAKSLAWSICVLDPITAMALDAAGNAYVGGFVGSTSKIWAAKLSADRGQTLWRTDIGNGRLNALAADASGLYATGTTTDAAFPTTAGAFQTVYAGPASNAFGYGDAFIVKLNASNSEVLFSTYVGGAGFDEANAIRVAAGSVWIAGLTNSPDFPITKDAVQPHFKGKQDHEGSVISNAFFARLSSTGSTLLYSTFLGGTGSSISGDAATALIVDRGGSVYIAGSTYSSDFPLVAPVETSCFYDSCAFVTEILPTGIGYSTYFHGSVTGMALDSNADLWLVGNIGRKQRITGGPPPLGDYGSDAGYVATLCARAPVIPRIWDNGVMDGASLTSSALAPGEFITIFGEALGPNGGASAVIGPDGVVTTSTGGVRVLVDGAAVPVMYASPLQVNAVLPFGLPPNSTAHIEIEYNGVRSNVVTASAQTVAPVVFATGLTFADAGHAAALNEDGTLNSPAYPAHAGSIVTLYVTGAGAMSPPQHDGEVLARSHSVPVVPMTASVGSRPAQILYAGNAPGLVAGVIQINLLIPNNVYAADYVEVSIDVGGVQAFTSITIQ